MICLSMYSNNPAEYINLPQEVDIIELRLDLNNFNFKIAKEIIKNSDKKIIVTDKNINSEKEILLNNILELKPEFIDLDIDNDEKLNIRLIDKARRNSASVIMSYHNYEVTPSLNKLECVIRKCLEYNSDVVKIACKVNYDDDNSKLLSLYNRQRKIISLGIGVKGRITRIAALFLGAPWTYVSLNNKHKTADGQYELKRLLSIIENINYV